MNRDAPKGVPPYAQPTKQRESRSLRAQLTRAMGDALRAVRNSKTGASSKQRLSDVLWNDRTLLASARATEAARSEAEELTNPRGTLGVPVVQPAAAPEAVEVVSDGEVAAWLLEEPARPVQAKAQAENPSSGPVRRRTVTPAQVRPAPEEERVRKLTPPQPSAAQPAPIAAGVAGRERKPTPPQPKAPSVARSRVATPPQVTTKPAAERAAPEPLRARRPSPVPLEAASLQIGPPPPAAGVAVAPPVVAAPARPVPPRVVEDDAEESGDEPIQTRSMARLLAMQGHRRRALAIYDALLRADAGDASLLAEAEKLRQSG